MTVILDRRTLLGGFAIGAASLGVTPSRARSANRATFAVLGDWGRDTPEQHHVAAAMGRTAATAQADFVLAIGDNFYTDGVASVDDPLWQSVFEGVYTHPGPPSALPRPPMPPLPSIAIMPLMPPIFLSFFIAVCIS